MTVRPARSRHALPARVAPAGARSRRGSACAPRGCRAHAGRCGHGHRSAGRHAGSRARGGARSSSSTSQARFVGLGCTGWARANESLTRSPVRAERPRRPTPPRSISRRRSPTGRRSSCRAAFPARVGTSPAGSPEPGLGLGRGARRTSGHRAGDGPEDRGLPDRPRRLPLGRGPRCDPGNRSRARRAAAGSRFAVIVRILERGWPTLLVLAALCRDRACQCRAGSRHCRRRRCGRSWGRSPGPEVRFPALRSRSSSSAGGAGGAARSARPQRARAGDRSIGGGDDGRDRSRAKDTSSRFAFQPRCVGSIRACSASESCSSCPSAARRRRAPSSSCGHRRRSSRCGGRLRRTRLAGAPRRSRRAARR